MYLQHINKSRDILFAMLRNLSASVRIRPMINGSGFCLLKSFSAICKRSSLHTYTRLLNTPEDKKKIQSQKLETPKLKPMLMLAFTCKKCDTRSSHTMSKQAYTKGTVLIQCPQCKNRHLIADHLKIFQDHSINIEDIMRAKGESVSVNSDNLAFEDIPSSLKTVIGHSARDAPDAIRKNIYNKPVFTLPTGATKD